MNDPTTNVRPLHVEDHPWARQLVEERWGLPVVTPSGAYGPEELPGFVAWRDGARVGLVTYRCEDGACEVVVLLSLVENRGVGAALLDAVRRTAQASGCRRVWLITTDDNSRAIRFYQRRGMEITRVHRNFVAVVAACKPAVSDLEGRRPFVDAVEFEWLLR